MYYIGSELNQGVNTRKKEVLYNVSSRDPKNMFAVNPSANVTLVDHTEILEVFGNPTYKNKKLFMDRLFAQRMR